MYDKMHDTEVLDLAMEGDGEAVWELLRRQQQGRAQRLYPYGRSGANDEGVMPLAIRMDELNLLVVQGCIKMIVLEEHDWQRWVVTAARLMHEAVAKRSREGMSNEEIAILSEQTATKHLQVIVAADPMQPACTTWPEKDDSIPAAIGCAFYPTDRTVWRLGVSGVRQFVGGIMRAAEKLGWRLQASDEERDIVQTFCD